MHPKPTTKAALLSAAEREYQALRASTGDLAERRLTELWLGDWSVSVGIKSEPIDAPTISVISSWAAASGGTRSVPSQTGAPEGTYVNLVCFKRRSGLSSHLKEAAASKKVINSAQRSDSANPKGPGRSPVR